MIKDIGGNILTSEESVLRVLKEQFEELRNENERENKTDGKNGSYKASEGSFGEVEDQECDLSRGHACGGVEMSWREGSGLLNQISEHKFGE